MPVRKDSLLLTREFPVKHIFDPNTPVRCLLLGSRRRRRIGSGRIGSSGSDLIGRSLGMLGIGEHLKLASRTSQQCVVGEEGLVGRKETLILVVQCAQISMVTAP